MGFLSFMVNNAYGYGVISENIGSLKLFSDGVQFLLTSCSYEMGFKFYCVFFFPLKYGFLFLYLVNYAYGYGIILGKYCKVETF